MYRDDFLLHNLKNEKVIVKITNDDYIIIQQRTSQQWFRHIITTCTQLIYRSAAADRKFCW